MTEVRDGGSQPGTRRDDEPAGHAAPATPGLVGPRLALTLLVALAAWEVGQVTATWLTVKVLAPGVPLLFDATESLQIATLAGLLLRAAVVLAVAAPVALVLLRPVLGYRDR